MKFLNLKKLNIFYLFFTLLTLAGCSGSSGPTYLAITSHSPGKSAKNVAYNKNIVVNFSEKLDEENLVNTDVDIKSLLTSKGLLAQNPTTKDELTTVTIAQILKGEAVVASVETGEAIGLTAANWSGSGNSRVLTLVSAEKTVVYTAAELVAAKLDQKFQNIITLKNQLGERVAVSISITGSKLTIDPVAYFSWKETYTVSIKKELLSLSGNPLNTDFTYSFEIQNQPEVKITQVSPTGSDASPLSLVSFTTNFEINGDSYLGNLNVYEVNDSSSTLVPGDLSIDSMSKVVSFSPHDEAGLKYSQKYNVEANNSSNPLYGSIGVSPYVSLDTPKSWTFTTSKPKIVSFNPVDPLNTLYQNPVTSKIKVTFNFKPSSSSVNNQNIIIKDENGIQLLASNFNIQETLVEITAPLDYGKVYTVTVSPRVVSKYEGSVHLDANKTYNFSTEKRKVIAVSPSPGQKNVSRQNITVKAQFNFDALQSSVNVNTFTVSALGSNLPGTVTYSNSAPGTASFRTAKFVLSPSISLDFNDILTARIKYGVTDSNGRQIQEEFSWNFTLLNENLEVESYSPQGDFVPVNESIRITMNKALSGIKENGDDVEKDAFDVRYASGSFCYGNIKGTFSWNGSKSLYFDPDQNLQSGCRVVVTLNEDVEGFQGEEQEDAFTYTFETDYLDIEKTPIPYVDNTFPIDEGLDFYFTHDIKSVFLYDVELFEGSCSFTSSLVSIDTYQSGDKLTILPYSDLKNSQEYCVVLSNIESTSGETLLEDYEFEFTTESFSLTITDYGAVGDSVSIYDEFYVAFDKSISGTGLTWSASITDEYGEAVVFDYYELSDEIGIFPLSALNEGAVYDVSFEMSLPGGDPVELNWSVTTEYSSSSASPLAARSLYSRNGCSINSSCSVNKKTISSSQTQSSLSQTTDQKRLERLEKRAMSNLQKSSAVKSM